jgi:peptidoglycan/xylan/chitin deacetylase (PgdA/CDA1 family)
MNPRLASSLLRTLALADGRALAGLLRAGLGGSGLALCFHRVANDRREGELLPKLTMPEAQIDRLVEFVLEAGGRRERWLTVSFDDGYRDAAEYVLSRAPRFPQIEWLFFVCPEKTEAQAGFRWDLAETLRSRAGLDDDSIIFPPVDLASENCREELRRLAADPRFALADVDLCRRIQRLPNASLGNHTNVHHRPVLLGIDDYRAEYERSTQDFRRLFGEPRHFAFPFGVPEVDFGPEHVEVLRRIGSFEIWSTEPRPYHPAERDRGAVLPRFAVDGTRTWKECAAHIALRSIRSRVQGRVDRYPRRALPGEVAREALS